MRSLIPQLVVGALILWGIYHVGQMAALAMLGY